MATRRQPSTSPRGVRRIATLPPWLRLGIVGLLMLACWCLVFATGGTRTALPHAFYVPVLLSALFFGLRGGVMAGLVATLLCGPLMPLDTATAEAQPLLNWLARGGFFVLIGALAGASMLGLRHEFEAGLAAALEDELGPPRRDVREEPLADWEPRLRAVMVADDVRIVYQPIYALDDGRLLAVEALSRFGGEPGPDVWLARAHDLGLGVDLELTALRIALAQGGDLAAGVALSLNVSPQCLLDPRCRALFRDNAHRGLIVEVTEHTVVDDYQDLHDTLTPLREAGVWLAVDDAGAGFASLRHIVRLHPDVIKLDPSLTQHVQDDVVRRPLADALIRFARRTDSAIVVEGIEVRSDLLTWRSLGAHAAQGYLLAPPSALPVPPAYAPLANSPNTGATPVPARIDPARR